MIPETHSMSTDEEEFDKREFGIVQCLPVDDGLPIDLDNFGIPDTVEEYLRRVRSVALLVLHKHLQTGSLVIWF